MTGRTKLRTAAGTGIALAALLAGAASSGGEVDGDQQQAQQPVKTSVDGGDVTAGRGIGDPYYPADGSRGYNVAGYRVRLDYFRPTRSIAATTTIHAKAAQRLDRFNLDLVGLRVQSVTVNGGRATFVRRKPHELVITPRRAVAAGSRFVTVVSYHGKPGTVPDGGSPSGWFDARTPGAGFVAGEPHSCTLWYPCNDHPTDKARFRLTATVPRPFAVVSGGRQGRTSAGNRPNGAPVRTYRWRLTEPTATYLTTIYIDKLRFDRSRLADGTRVVSAYGPGQDTSASAERRLGEVLRMLSRRWGPYPAPQAGGIFVDAALPFSLEIFTRPLYTSGAGLQTIVHENAHQWWGDNVSIKRWRDICFNECLASYSQWLWDERAGANLDARYRRGIRRDNTIFQAPLYDMGPGHEFDSAVYYKGPFFVHALRNKVGDARFFAAMQEIQRQHPVGNMSMLELRDALEHKTGVDLTSFWREWVLNTVRPSPANLFPGDL